MLRALAHETAHACLTMLGHWPAWLQEGIAQKLSGDSLNRGPNEEDRRAGPAGKTAAPEQPQAGLVAHGRRACRAAYALSLAAVELLWQDSGDEGVRNLLRNPDRLPQVTADLDRKLGL